MHKKWTTYTSNSATVKSLQEALKIHPIFCSLLVERGISNFEEAKNYFRPELKDLHNPFLMKDMDKAIQRINYALKRNERILIYGDYDVDGTTSVALVYSFLKDHFEHIDFYIPDRYTEGYGLSKQAIDWASKHEISLVITLDCGITNVEQVAYANDKNIDFIICDHHLPSHELPKAYAILDAKQADCNYPFKELSGCGVGFKLLQGFCIDHKIEYDHLFSYLDLVTISIACDIVPIVGENRILAYHGLKILNENPRPGIGSIYDIVGIRTIDEETGEVNYNDVGIDDVVFKIGPKINAAGRIQDAKDAVRMMISEDEVNALEYASLITDLNETRQEKDKIITEEAIQIVKNSKQLQQQKSLVLYSEDWHKGVIGIVASRVVEEFYKPTIMLTLSDGVYTGSARSVKGFDIHAALKANEDLLEKFGGHMYAAGMSILPKNLKQFIERFEYTVESTIKEHMLYPEIIIDSELGISDITPEFFNLLQQFGPFGPQNEKPVFVAKQVEDTGKSRIVGDNHLKVAVKDGGSKHTIDGIAFNQKQYFKPICSNRHFDLCFTLNKNTWRGRSSIQMDVKDIKFS